MERSRAFRSGTAQAVRFLNAKAKSDPHGFYNINMRGNTAGGITRNGTSGHYTYAARNNDVAWDNRPVS